MTPASSAVSPASSPPASSAFSATAGHSEHRKVAIASLVGTALEWYDYFIYGACAALIFPKLFFPSFDPIVGTIAAFATYAVGFLARPVGAVVIGHYGDKLGRRAMLMVSLLLMGGATVAIGLLPTYERIGPWAAVLLCLMREWGAAVAMSVEHAPRDKRGFYGSFPQVGVPIGMLIATGAFSIVSGQLSEEALLAWGWRVPFLASIVMVAVGIYARLRLEESPAFQKVRAKKEILAAPAMEVLRENRRALFITIGMRMVQNAVYYLYTTFILSYIVNTLHMQRQVGLNAVLISSAIGIFSLPAWAWLSDKIGRRKITLFGTIGSTFFAFPFFMMAQTGNVWVLTLGIVIALNLIHDAIYGPQAVYFSELFGTKVRLSGANMGYAIGSVLGGGFAPMIATALLAATGGKTWGVSLYIMLLGIFSIAACLAARETYQDAIDG